MRRELILDTGVAETDNQPHAMFPFPTNSSGPQISKDPQSASNYFFFASLASAAGAAGVVAASVLPFFATSGSVGAAATSSTGATSSLMTVTWATVACSSPRNLMLPECGRSET